MPKGTYAGRGAQAVPKGSKLGKDIIALSDEEKLEKKVAAKQKAIRQKDSSSWGAAKKFAAKKKKKTPGNIQKRAADLRAKAQAVETSGTGNKRAAETYRQAARELLARIPKGK